MIVLEFFLGVVLVRVVVRLLTTSMIWLRFRLRLRLRLRLKIESHLVL